MKKKVPTNVLPWKTSAIDSNYSSQSHCTLLSSSTQRRDEVWVLKNNHHWLVVEPTHLKNMLVKLGITSPRYGMKHEKIWMFPKIGVPPKWLFFFMENPIEMDDLGGNLLFLKNIHISNHHSLNYLNGGTPKKHPKCWSFFVGKTSWVCWGNPPF